MTSGSERGGLGRYAALPRQLPLKAWFRIFKRLGLSFLDDHLSLVAAGVAFWSLLALFPALALFVSIYGIVADPTRAANQAIALAPFLPQDASQFLLDEMIRVAGTATSRLGFGAAVSFLLALWGSNRSMKAIFEALNVAYRERETRNLLVINLLGLVFTVGFILFGVLTVVLIVVVPPFLDGLPSGELESVMRFLRWPFLFAGMITGTSLLYAYGASREPPRFRWISWGAIFAGVLWLLASNLISWYAANFANFNKTYGSLGAVIVLQLWIWLTVLVVITGAKLNAEAEHQTSVDTTTGPEKPMGERGAYVADTVAGEGRPTPVLGSERGTFDTSPGG